MKFAYYTYLKNCCPNYFGKKYGSKISYLHTIWTYVSKISYIFLWLSLALIYAQNHLSKVKFKSISQGGGVGPCSGSFLYISFVWNYILWIWEVYAPRFWAALLLPRIRVLAPRSQGDSTELKLIDKGYYCHNPYSATTQLNKSWVWHENDFTPPPTTTTANSMSVISQLFLTCF